MIDRLRGSPYTEDSPQFSSLLREVSLSRSFRRVLFAAMFALMAELCLAKSKTQRVPDSAAAQDQSQPATEQPPQGQPSSTPEAPEQPQAAPQPKPTPPAAASNQPSVQLDTSETLFAVLTAINVCGYDEELGLSDPLREQIRGEVSQAIQQSEEAKETATAMCQFYEQHRQPDSSKTRSEEHTSELQS